MRDISIAGGAALNAGRLKQGHLIALELPYTVIYVTDYMRDVEFEGRIYKAGKVKQISNYTQTIS